jgi:hypothetical protein
MKIIKFNNGRYSEPPGFGKYTKPPGSPASSCSSRRAHIPDGNNVWYDNHPVTFESYRIPQFNLDIQLRPKGNRQPREEANILGRIKYNLQLNGFRGDRG